MFLAGDIAACYGVDRESQIIRWGTASLFAPRGLRMGPSHVAILAETSARGLLWFESTSLCRRPCVITGEQRRGTQAHYIVPRIDDYTRDGGRVEVFRLVPFWELSPQDSHELAQLLTIAVDLRLAYDLSGALLSGTRLLKLSRFLYADLESVFCSELVAAALQKVGLMPHENPMRFNPASLLRRLVRTGIYRRYVTFFRGGHEFDEHVRRQKDLREERPCVAA